MHMEQKLYVVEYTDASGETTGIDWYSDFVGATGQFKFAVANTEGPGHSVTMYSGYDNRAEGQTTEDYVMAGHWPDWPVLGGWTDPRPVITEEEAELYQNAASLFGDMCEVDIGESEYARGVVELIMTLTGKGSDDMEQIAATLASYVR